MEKKPQKEKRDCSQEETNIKAQEKAKRLRKNYYDNQAVLSRAAIGDRKLH